jgi:hypothetical protein
MAALISHRQLLVDNELLHLVICDLWVRFYSEFYFLYVPQTVTTKKKNAKYSDQGNSISFCFDHIPGSLLDFCIYFFGRGILKNHSG